MNATATNATATRVYPQIKRVHATTPTRLATLREVALHVEEAHRLLQELRKTEKSGDVAYFAEELGEWLTCDHGEAGFNAFIGIFQASE